jgi:3-oxoacyl-[acyl-carrier-protein] synthase-3
VSAFVVEPVPRAHPADRAPYLPSSRIAGTGYYVPEQRLTNADLERLMDTSDEWIVERTGIRERRLAAPDEAAASMAVSAAVKALDNAQLRAEDIDLCIVATCTADQPLPSTASFVADALGIGGGAFDLGAACAGFVYGLISASAMVGTGGTRAALVIGSEVLSRIVDFTDRSTGMLFGDGAGAVVVVPSGGAGPSGPSDAPGLLAWDVGSDRSSTGILEIPAGGSRLPATAATVEAGLHFMRMDGREVYRRAIRAVVDSVEATLARAGVAPADVDLFIPHQANARIVDAVLPRLGIDASRTFTNIARYGNTSSASIPIALSEAGEQGRLHDGDLVLLTGFGAGMTWASALLRWGPGREHAA